MRKALSYWGVFLAVVLCAVLATALGACDSPAVDPCKVHPTKQAADGTWVEWDDGPLDDDPCDADDLFGEDHKVKTPPVVKKPEPKKTPAKPVAPIGGTKKRF